MPNSSSNRGEEAWNITFRSSVASSEDNGLGSVSLRCCFELDGRRHGAIVTRKLGLTSRTD